MAENTWTLHDSAPASLAPTFSAPAAPWDQAVAYWGPGTSATNATAGGTDATATVTRIAAAAALGTVSASGGASVTASGVGSAAAVGSVTATGAGYVSASGLSVTASVGAVQEAGGATAAPSGQTATSALGTATGSGEGFVEPSGVALLSDVGTVQASGTEGQQAPADGFVTVSGLAFTADMGDVSAWGENVSPLPPPSDSQNVPYVGYTYRYVRRPAAELTVDATATVTGIGATFALGQVTASGTSSIGVKGLELAATMTAPAARADAVLPIKGLGCESRIGDVHAFDLTVRVAQPYAPPTMNATATVRGFGMRAALEAVHASGDDAVDREWRDVQRTHDDADLAVLV